MAGSFIDRTNPSFDDLGRREVINLRCKCGREVQIAPYQLIGQHGIQPSSSTARSKFDTRKVQTLIRGMIVVSKKKPRLARGGV
jgi:hypothetical protein